MGMGPVRGDAGDDDDGDGGYAPMAEINVTPMVDVMLVLLVIFMVAAPLMTVGVPLQLPKTSAAVMAHTDQPVVVSIDAEGKVFLKDQPTSEETLASDLRQATGGDSTHVILVRGDKAVRYDRVMDVLGAISRAGFARVSLIALGQPPRSGS